MRILITGAHGQLGQALQANTPSGKHITALARHGLDITQRRPVDEAIRALKPAWIINAAAYAAVDKAEEEPDQAKAVNETAVRNLAEAAEANGARLIHISTDFVFDGTSNRPYLPDDDPNPLNVYGRTKLAGERAAMAATHGDAIVIRTAWLYSLIGKNFLTTMQRLMHERDALKIVDDQRGTPTAACDLATAIWALVSKSNTPGGIYHYTNAGDATWYEFAVEIRRLLKYRDPDTPLAALESVDTTGFPTPARRPAYSVLDCRATAEVVGREPHWKYALKEELGMRSGLEVR